MTRPTLTRRLLPAALAASLACEAPQSARPIPQGQLYFPTGMFFARPAAAAETSGALFVASSNFDRRYTNGRITGIDVSSLACGTAAAGECVPAFPAPATASPVDIPSFGTTDEKGLASLGGEIDGIETAPGSGVFRLLVPSRAEGSPLQFLETTGEQITCLGDPASGDCAVGAKSLEANRLSATGVPRAPAPFSVSISKLPDNGTRRYGDAFVTSLQPADSPAASATNLAVYTVRLNALDPPDITDNNFLNLGITRTESVRMGRKYVFMTGAQSLALRLIDRDTLQQDSNTGFKALNAFVEANVNILDTRGLALASDESEVFVLSRNPDALLAMSARGTDTDTPVLSLTHMELLPLGASQVQVLDKPSPSTGRVVFVTCLGTQSYDATGQAQGSLIVFDSEAGQPVATLAGFGFSPYGLAVQTIGPGARLYVGLFGEGRIAVVDVPNLQNPEDIRLVARLGSSHVCTVNPGSRGCTSSSP